MGIMWGGMRGAIFGAGIFTLQLGFVMASMAAPLCLDDPNIVDWQEGPHGTVAAVPDGGTLILDNGEMVRLTGIQAPKLSLGRTDMDDWPLAQEARDYLADRVLGKSVQLWQAGAKRDRHNRLLAQVVDAQGNWLQADLVTQGLARTYSFPDNRACIVTLYTHENAARVARRGIWSHQMFKIHAAEQPEGLTGLDGELVLVEGRVLRADKAGSRIYLNFGRVWREDFTVVIGRAAQKLFQEEGQDPLVLENALIRVRGWLETYDGPRVEVTHPEQIEVLATR